MKVSKVDVFFKWFFLGSALYYFVMALMLFDKGDEYFDSFINSFIYSATAVYYYKKPDQKWVRENIFFILASITGFLLTKTYYLYSHDLPYLIPAFLSAFVALPCVISFAQHIKDIQNSPEA